MDRWNFPLFLIAIENINRIGIGVVRCPDNGCGVGYSKIDGAQFLIMGRDLKRLALNNFFTERKHHAFSQYRDSFASHVPLIFRDRSK